jgi:hypothetical protein
MSLYVFEVVPRLVISFLFLSLNDEEILTRGLRLAMAFHLSGVSC